MSFKIDNTTNPKNPFLGDKNYTDVGLSLALKFYPNMRDIGTIYGLTKFSSPTAALQNTNISSVKIDRGN